MGDAAGFANENEVHFAEGGQATDGQGQAIVRFAAGVESARTRVVSMRGGPHVRSGQLHHW